MSENQEIPCLELAHYRLPDQAIELFDDWYGCASYSDWVVPLGNVGPVLVVGAFLGSEKNSITSDIIKKLHQPCIQIISLKKDDFEKARVAYLQISDAVSLPDTKVGNDLSRSQRLAVNFTSEKEWLGFWRKTFDERYLEGWDGNHDELPEALQGALSRVCKGLVVVDLSCFLVQEDPPEIRVLLGRFESLRIRSWDDRYWFASPWLGQSLFEDRIRNRLPERKPKLMWASREQIAAARQSLEHKQMQEHCEEPQSEDEGIYIVHKDDASELHKEDVESGLRYVFAKSILLQATDIHFEEQRIRIRRDGLLIHLMSCSLEWQRALVSVVKGMSGMDQANVYNRQDGSFSVAMDDRLMNVRASAVPLKNHSKTSATHKLVLRLLPGKQPVQIKLEQLGYTSEQSGILRRALSRPQGLILITGPTGSGKTTTIYSLLREIARGNTNIMTLEDPIEYEIAGINQTQLDPLRGLTIEEFRKGYVRQDPDVLFLGEIRDYDTASFAMEASLTGHLVISTLHTESAVGAVHRLIALGVNPEILSQSLLLLQAQRLVRKLCTVCRSPVAFHEQDASARWGQIYEKHGITVPHQIYRAQGCARCQDSGYSGRALVVELLPVTRIIAQAIAVATLNNLYELRELAESQSAVTLFKDSLRLLTDGVISVNEAELYGDPWEEYNESGN